MNTCSRYTSAGLFGLVFFGLILASCGTPSDTNPAGNDAARPEAQAGLDDTPLARYDAGRLMLAVSEAEAREALMETGRKLELDVEEVRFRAPALELIEGRAYLTMNGSRADGNCVLVYQRLGRVTEGRVEEDTRLTAADDAVLYKAVGGSCKGNPCSGCHISYVPRQPYEICVCHGTCPSGEECHCDHSTGG